MVTYGPKDVIAPFSQMCGYVVLQGTMDFADVMKAVDLRMWVFLAMRWTNLLTAPPLKSVGERRQTGTQRYGRQRVPGFKDEDSHEPRMNSLGR
jgi:hypothetical protein